MSNDSRLKRLMRGTFGRWSRQQKNAVNSGPQSQKRRDTTAKMGDDDVIGADSVVGQLDNLALGGEGHHANPIQMSEEWNSFKINEGGTGEYALRAVTSTDPKGSSAVGNKRWIWTTRPKRFNIGAPMSPA